MLLSLLRYLGGYLKIRIVGYSPERFLNLCRHHHIYLWGLRPCKNNYELFISVKNFRKLKPIIKKTRTKVVILNRYGLPFFLHKYRKRKVFFAGFVCCVISIYVMSAFVWNIHIEGNYSRTDEVILEYLKTTGVYHGMRKSQIDCPRIVKDIRKKFDDIIWASASVEGTRLLIQVKENTDTVRENTEKEEEASDLVAAQDGKIVRIITRTGVPLVAAGDAVKKGDILVSGRVEIKNDAQEVTGYRYQTADADIYMEVTENYENTMSVSFEKKEYTGRKRTLFYIRSRHHLLKLGVARNKFENIEEYTTEEQLKLGEHFYFPLSFGKIEKKEYKIKTQNHTQKELQKLLSDEFQLFCRDLAKKGVAIIEKDVKIYNGQKKAAAKGEIILIKPAYEKKETEVIPIENKSEIIPEGVS